MMKGKK